MSPELNTEGASWHLDDVQNWLANLPFAAASAISNSLEDGSTEITQQGVKASAQVIASWSEAAATALGLPPSTPLGFDIRLSGTLGRPGASLTVRWLQPGRIVPVRNVERDGPWLKSDDKVWRIPSPIFGALELVEAFNAIPGDSFEQQFRMWSHIRNLLGEEKADTLTDGFLRLFRVVTATALTFGITTDESGDVQIEPVLLTERRAPEGEGMEQIRALTTADETLFPKRLDQLREGVPAFPISQGTYVVVDEALQQALAAVRTIRKAPAEQRKRAAMYPEAVIRECLGLTEDAPTVFVETECFAGCFARSVGT